MKKRIALALIFAFLTAVFSEAGYAEDFDLSGLTIEKLEKILANPHKPFTAEEVAKITKFLEEKGRHDLVQFLKDKPYVVDFLAHGLKELRFSSQELDGNVYSNLEKFYKEKCDLLNDSKMDSPVYAVLTLYHGCGLGESISTDYVRKIIQRHQGNDAPVSCFDALGLLVKATTFARQKEGMSLIRKPNSTKFDSDSEYKLYAPCMTIQWHAIMLMAGVPYERSPFVDMSRRATKYEFERIANIVEEMVENTNYRPVCANPLTAFGDNIFFLERKGVELNHRQNLFALALYKLGKSQNMFDEQLLEYVVGGLNRYSHKLHKTYNKRDVTTLFSEIGQTFDYEPLKTFGRSLVVDVDRDLDS